MFNEINCLENLKHIVSEFADEENLKNLSVDELRSSYTEIADNMYCISISSRHKYKNMLWNIDNLRPEIRSRFQKELFSTWHAIYIKSAKAHLLEDLPETEKQESTPLSEAEKSPEVDVQEQTYVMTDQQSGYRDTPESATSSEDADVDHDMKPKETPSPIRVSMSSANKYENDWFDKLLDFFAAIVGGASRIFGH